MDIKIFKFVQLKDHVPIRLELSPSNREVGVPIPAAIDLTRKIRLWQLHFQTFGNRYECHGSSEIKMTILNGCPVWSFLKHNTQLVKQ